MPGTLGTWRGPRSKVARSGKGEPRSQGSQQSLEAATQRRELLDVATCQCAARGVAGKSAGPAWRPGKGTAGSCHLCKCRSPAAPLIPPGAWSDSRNDGTRAQPGSRRSAGVGGHTDREGRRRPSCMTGGFASWPALPPPCMAAAAAAGGTTAGCLWWCCRQALSSSAWRNESRVDGPAHRPSRTTRSSPSSSFVYRSITASAAPRRPLHLDAAVSVPPGPDSVRSTGWAASLHAPAAAALGQPRGPSRPHVAHAPKPTAPDSVPCTMHAMPVCTCQASGSNACNRPSTIAEVLRPARRRPQRRQQRRAGGGCAPREKPDHAVLRNITAELGLLQHARQSERAAVGPKRA